MRKFILTALLCASAVPCFAQLTLDQKISDFKDLVALYDKNYGPYKWKAEVFDFDLLRLKPWLDKIYASEDDLSFYDICVRYVASLHDFHDEFTLPSYYEAYLPFTADIYDGKVLVDSVNSYVLNPLEYPISIGDEVVSVDGVCVYTWMARLAPYAVNGEGNPVSRDRLAVATMLDRYQGWYTYASDIKPGQVAKVVIKGAKGTATYSIPWETIFLPLFSEGPVPNPRDWRLNAHSIRETSRAAANKWRVAADNVSASPRAGAARPTAADPHKRLREFSHLRPNHVLAGGLNPFGSLYPVFDPPPGFVERLGSNPNDYFLSGTLPVGKSTVGFIRIPSFEPADEYAALTQFAGEIAYFQQNTSGLVIDVMSNGGGSICYAQALLEFLIPTQFRDLGFSLRATENWLEDFEYSLYVAEVSGAPESVVDEYAGLLEQVQQALRKERGMTPPLPLCSSTLADGPATDQNGNNLAYKKPIVVLTDNFTASAAEMFGATLQDAQRATVYGTRTSGGGGNVVSFDTAPYAEGATRVTESIAVRNHDVTTPGYPSAPYIENIGVYPDVLGDYQKKDNLLTGGQPFVAGFSEVMSKLIGR